MIETSNDSSILGKIKEERTQQLETKKENRSKK